MAEKKTKSNEEHEIEPKQKTCFVISPIGADGSEERRHANQLIKHVVRPVLEAEPFHYQVRRADSLNVSGMITNQIVEQLLSADLVIADLSFKNPNVFYELALRHAIRKPFIHMIRESDMPLPFDVAGVRTITFDLSDLDSVEEARDDLEKWAVAIDSGAETSSPFSNAQAVLAGSSSGDPVMKMFSLVLDEIDGLKSRTSNVPAQGTSAQSYRFRTFRLVATNIEFETSAGIQRFDKAEFSASQASLAVDDTEQGPLSRLPTSDIHSVSFYVDGILVTARVTTVARFGMRLICGLDTRDFSSLFFG